MTATALRISGLFWIGLVLITITAAPLVAVLYSSPISQPDRTVGYGLARRDALGHHHHNLGGLEQVVSVSW